MNRVLLDACVLVPTLTRRLLVAAAGGAVYQPLWSPRILREWHRAAARSGPVEALAVAGETALLNARFPGALVTPSDDADPPDLPDPGDRHVLGAAIAGRAQELLTFNSRDFPLAILSRAGVTRRHPDEFLLEALARCRAELVEISERASRDLDTAPRRLLRKAQLPRLGKALFGGI